MFAYMFFHKKIWWLWRGTLQAPKQGEGRGELLAATLPLCPVLQVCGGYGCADFLLALGRCLFYTLSCLPHLSNVLKRNLCMDAPCFLWYPHLPQWLVLDRFEPLYNFGFWGHVFLIDTLLSSSANCSFSILHVWVAPSTIVSPAFLCQNICAFRKMSLG